MFKKRKVFIVISFQNIQGLFDYPKDLPLPRTGEKIIFNEKCGTVEYILHNTTGTVTEIKIRCTSDF